MRLAVTAAVFAGLALTGAALAHPSVSLVMDAAGNVYYSDLRQVWRLAPDGRKSVVVAGVHTHELCLDRDGGLYGEHLWYEGEATDRWGHRVWRLGRDGVLTDVYPARAGFRTDTSFVRDGEGNQYWAELYVEGRPAVLRRKSPFGAVTSLVEAPLGRVGWMSVDRAGSLFFTAGGSGSRAASDLYRRSASGRLERLAAHLDEHRATQFWVRSFHDVYGVWPDESGGAYVAVLGARLVKHVEADGRVTVAARSPVPWAPTGGLLARDGALWLLEVGPLNGVRVRRIGVDGRERVY